MTRGICDAVRLIRSAQCTLRPKPTCRRAGHSRRRESFQAGMPVPRAWRPAVALPPSAEAEVVVPRPSAAEEVEEQPAWAEGAAASAWLPVAAEVVIPPALEAPGAQHWLAAKHRGLPVEPAVE